MMMRSTGSERSIFVSLRHVNVIAHPLEQQLDLARIILGVPIRVEDKIFGGVLEATSQGAAIALDSARG